MHLVFISAGAVLANFACSPSRAALRPGPVSRSATTALISALVPASTLAFTSAPPLANPSWSSAHSPPVSAMDTAIPAAITLSNSSVHSCAAKLLLSAIAFLLVTTRRPSRWPGLGHQLAVESIGGYERFGLWNRAVIRRLDRHEPAIQR